MKKAILCLACSMTLSAKAEVLKCWNVYSKRGAKPTVVAQVVNNRELTSVEVNANPDDFTDNLKAPKGKIVGAIITSNRSPYKGNQEFPFGGARLILPAELDQESLRLAQGKGIGMGAGENGVIIGSFDGDGAGSHFSVRLRCRSYAR